MSESLTNDAPSIVTIDREVTDLKSFIKPKAIETELDFLSKLEKEKKAASRKERFGSMEQFIDIREDDGAMFRGYKQAILQNQKFKEFMAPRRLNT